MSDKELALSASSDYQSSDHQQSIGDEETAIHAISKEQEQEGNEDRRQLTGFKVRFSHVK